MEIKKIFRTLALILTLASCSNTPELETGEIKTLQVLKNAIIQSRKSKKFINARDLLSRKQIDESNTAVLFVELKTGQNGTLTPYPGKGDGQTWLGADGATLTLDNGILKASRGMGADLMGSTSTFPLWKNISSAEAIYTRELSYIDGNNKIYRLALDCTIKKNGTSENLKIWGLIFFATRYDEICHYPEGKIANTYYLDKKEIVRRSIQYHSESIGYITIERLDRL